MTPTLDHRTARTPATWSGKLVLARLVEAYAVLKRLPDRDRTRGLMSAWPATPVHEFADVVNWEDASARVWESWGRPSSASSLEVSRMEAALTWLGWLPEGERRCLQILALASATRRMKVRKVLKARGIPSSTFYTKCNQGAARIADRLNRDGIAVR